MDAIRKRILRALEEKGADMKEASLAIGRNHAYIQQYIERGIPAKLKEHDRAALADFLGIDEFEIGGRIAFAESKPDFSSFKFVSEYDVTVSAGGGAFIADENVRGNWPFDPKYLTDELGLGRAKLALLEVRGDSMEPTLSSGDRVMVNMSDKQVSQPGIFILFDGDGTVIKRVEKVPGIDKLILISDNSRHNQYEVDGDTVQIVGRVVWAARRM